MALEIELSLWTVFGGIEVKEMATTLTT